MTPRAPFSEVPVDCPVPEAEARDLLWTLNSAQVYDLLAVQREWPLQRYESFLAQTWTTTLLQPS